MQEILTLPGKLKRKGFQFQEWLGLPISESGKEYIQKARKFVEGLEQYFNQYRKRITGAQAAIKEIKMLRESVLNKNVTPSEYVASVGRVKDMLSRGIRLKRMLLAKGVRDRSSVDQMFEQGADVDDIEIDRYGDLLKSQGMSENEVLQALRREGYLRSE
jgi:hypothetical protein